RGARAIAAARATAGERRHLQGVGRAVCRTAVGPKGGSHARPRANVFWFGPAPAASHHRGGSSLAGSPRPVGTGARGGLLSGIFGASHGRARSWRSAPIGVEGLRGARVLGEATLAMGLVAEAALSQGAGVSPRLEPTRESK